MFKRVCVLFLLITAAINEVNARETIDRIVAIVNDDLVTLSEFNDYMSGLPELSKDIDKYQALNELVDQLLLEQEAIKLGIYVTDDEVKQSIANIKQQFGMSDEKMQEVLNKENLTPEQLNKQWKLQLLSNKIVGAKLKGKIAVTEDEIRDLYKQYYGDIENFEEVKIAQILITYNIDNEIAAEEKAQKVADLARSDGDFKKLVKEYSDDTSSKDTGGLLGYFQKGELVEELDEAISNMKVGETSDPVKTSSGFHIVKVLDIKSLDESSVDKYREQLKYELYKEKAAKELNKFISDLKENAYIEIKL